jgi:hypothetical protein
MIATMRIYDPVALVAAPHCQRIACTNPSRAVKEHDWFPEANFPSSAYLRFRPLHESASALN